jgi:MFS superfamily sulfate permease-like transporter
MVGLVLLVLKSNRTPGGVGLTLLLLLLLLLCFAGCKTGLSGFVTACVVGLVLLVLTPVFEKLPLNVMGAIVVSGVSGLFEYEQSVHLFKVRTPIVQQLDA